MATHSIANVSTLVSQTVSTGTSKRVELTSGRQGSAASGEQAPVEAPVSREAVEKVVTQLKTQSQNLRRDLQFAVDDDTGRVIVTVIDSETDEVVRQIPSEELVALSRHLQEAMEDDSAGFLFESKA